VTTPNRQSPHVPAQYYGYSLQTTRLLARLLEAEPGWTVSLEVFEDVGVEEQDGTRVAEQTKSASSSNPVSDKSVELWKTFANWADAVDSGELVLGKTKFVIYVSPQKNGAIVSSFDDAKTAEDARKALQAARSSLWGLSPQYALKSTVAAELAPYVEKVLGGVDDTTCAMICSFELLHSNGSPHDDLRKTFARLLVPEELIEDVLQFALGWVKEQTDRLIELKLPATISADIFHGKLIAYVRKHDRRSMLAGLARAPDQAAIDAHLRIKTYVAQLDLIEGTDEQKLTAIRDFLQASADRTQWGALGMVDESSFHEYEDSLVRSWTNHKQKTDIALSADTEVNRGQYLYAECCLVQAKLEGLEVPQYFVPGSFHALSDTEIVGWHPDYHKLLTKSL